MLSYRLVDPVGLGYRVNFDGVEIGSISRRLQHVQHRFYWHWGVDTMPLMSHGGRPPSGDADTFEEALVAFKAAFTKWHAGIDPKLWTKNVDYIEYCANRWRNRGT
jgi:hypothetical protein